MKVIFLDIDGVLNSNRYYLNCIKANFKKAPRDDFGQLFDPLSEMLLNALIDKTGAKVVISSTWRGDGEDAMKKMWKHRNMSGEVIAITPCFRGELGNISVPRGLEIKWYYENVFKYRHWNWDGEEVRKAIEESLISHYVIIDDDSDMLYEQRNNFVKCENLYGFRKREFNKAMKILNK